MAEEHRPKKQRKLTTGSPKTTTLATQILLDDAQHGFKSGNFVCSPFSLEIILGMVAAGAEGKTLKQLLGFLGHETIEQFHSEAPSSKLLQNILSNPDDGGQGLDISLANGVWADKKLNMIQSCYEEVLRTVYGTKARFIDIENKPDEAVKRMNSWANKKTKGAIPVVINKDALIDIVIIFANALYFKGLWSKPFDSNKTKKKKFYLIDGETVSVPFMSCKEVFNYGSSKGFKILQLPYTSKSRSKDFSMYIFLPDRKDGLQDLLQAFHSDNGLFHTRFDLERRDLKNLWIPKFKMSYNLDPKDVMKQMGLTLPFNPKNRGLTRIVDPGCHVGDTLYVSHIVQESLIEVDEKGTVAIAYSRMSGAGGATAPPPASFVADHPFMFMIREETSLAVFFMGVVLNPSA